MSNPNINSNIDLSTFLQLQSQYTNDLSNIPIDPAQKSNANAIQDLSNQLSTMYSLLNTSTASAQNTIDEQNKLNYILQNEYSRLQQKEQNVKNAVSGQHRVIELNNSYQKKYTAYTNIIIVFIVTLILYIIIQYVDNNVPIFPKSVLYLLTIILFSAAIIYIFWVYTDILRRDNVNFDELKLQRPTLDSSGNVISKIGTPISFNGINTCFRESCCSEGTVWDDEHGGCVNNINCAAQIPAPSTQISAPSTQISAPSTIQGFQNINTNDDIRFSNKFLQGISESEIDKNTLHNLKDSQQICTTEFNCFSLYKT